MNALIISLPAMIIGGLLALAGVVLGSRITARAMGGWFSPGPEVADQLLDEGDGTDKHVVPVVQSIRDIERREGAGEEESYPADAALEPAPEFIIPTHEGEPIDE